MCFYFRVIKSLALKRHLILLVKGRNVSRYCGTIIYILLRDKECTNVLKLYTKPKQANLKSILNKHPEKSESELIAQKRRKFTMDPIMRDSRATHICGM